MAAGVSENAMDAALDYIIGRATHLVILSGDPGDFAGIAAAELGRIAVSAGDFTKADGDGAGRKLTVGTKTGVSTSATGTATHVALIDNAGSELLALNEMSATNITAGLAVDTNAFTAWSIEQPI